MATQTREKEATADAPPPHSSTDNGHNGSDLGSSFAPAHDAPPESLPHPLASVLGSFRDDLASLDAIMAGVKKYRQQMEEDEQTP